MKIIPPVREHDDFGSGLYGASRDGGKRSHNGIDLACYPGSSVCSINSGTVTKLGYPYKDALQYRYVEVTNYHKIKFRYFYVKPSVSMNQAIVQGQILGKSQELNSKYPGITEHVHLELKTMGNEFLDPNDFI